MDSPERVSLETAPSESTAQPAGFVARDRRRGLSGTPPAEWIVLRSESLAKAAHYLSLVIALPVFLLLTRHHWFFADDWDFIAQRGLRGRSELGLMVPHNEHWSTIPILLYRALYAVFGLRTYVPYFLAAILVHLLVVHCVWRLLRQAGVGGWLAGALTLTLLLGGAGAENFLWSFQFGFNGALLCGLVLLLTVNRPKLPLPWRALAGILAVVSLLFAGVAVPLVATAAVLTWLRHGWRIAAQVAAPAACVYLLWFELVGKQGFNNTHPISKRGFLLVPSYTWKGLVTTVESYTFFAGAGAVILFGLGLVLIRMDGNSTAAERIALTGGLGAVIIFLAVAPGRVGLGIAQADAPRYHYLAWALLLPSIGVSLHRLVSGNAVRQLALIAVALACTAHGTDTLIGMARAMERRDQDHRRLITAAAELADSGAPVFDVPPHPVEAPNLTPSSLRHLLRSGALPTFTGVTGKDRLLAAAQLQLRLPPAASLPVPQISKTRLVGIANARTSVGSPGCTIFRPDNGRPIIALRVTEPSGLSVLSSDGGELRFLLRDANSLTVDSGRRLSLPAGITQNLDIATTETEANLLLPVSGSTTVCGIGT
jgi:hypothetical protein